MAEHGNDPGPTVLDLFAGAGGLSLGFHWAGCRPLVAIDHNPVAVETLEANFGHHHVKAMVRDLASYTAKDLRRDAGESGGQPSFDIIVGGPPCQGWSKVGRGKLASLRSSGGGMQDHRTDPRNQLYLRFLHFVREFQPQVAVMENVPGMLSHAGRNFAEVVASSLQECGYTVSWQLLNARDYGVPQARERLFFVGVRRDLGMTFTFPPAWDADELRLFPEVTVWEAIGDLPPIPNGSQDWRRPYPGTRRRSEYAERMRKDADPETIFDHVCRRQNAQDVAAFKLMKQGGWYRDLPAEFKRYRDDIFEDKYKKLYAHRPSWCVTAHLSRDCYTHIHPTQARTISIREAARLQSFPDCFYFAGNMGTKFSLIGNAVPPLLAEKIALAIRTQIFDRDGSVSYPPLPAGTGLVEELSVPTQA